MQKMAIHGKCFVFCNCYTLLIVAVTLVSAQLNLQCPSTSVSISNGTISFSPLSGGSGPVDAAYDASLVSRTWYSLANRFVDTVRNGGLPYELLIPVVNSTFIQPSSTETLESFDPITLLANFASWWAGILVVTLIGIILALFFCVWGCCFWVCRYGVCHGEKKHKEERNNPGCWMVTFSVILFLLTLVLLFAAVMSFLSNQQSFQVFNNLQDTTNTATEEAVHYITDTTEEVYELLFCQGGRVVGSILTELASGVFDLAIAVGKIAVQLHTSGIEDQLQNITSDQVLQETLALTDNITSTGVKFLSTTSMFFSSLGGIATDVLGLTAACVFYGTFGLCTSTFNNVAAIVNPSEVETPDELSNFTNFLSESLPDIINALSQSQLEDNFLLQLTTQLIDNTTTVPMIRNFTNELDRSLDLIKQVIKEATKILDTDFVADQCPPLKGFQAFSNVVPPNFNFSVSADSLSDTSSPTTPPGFFSLSVGYVKQCIISASFDYLKMLDTYRYALGVIVCLLSLITIVIIWVGLVCGLAGFRESRASSTLSTSGRILLLLAVGVTFLFGFFLLALSSIYFFFGANSLKMCQAVQGPNYELFAQTIDNPEVRASIGATAGNSSMSINDLPSISKFLGNCRENDTALFTALNLGPLLNFPSGSVGGVIRSGVNVTQLKSGADESINKLAKSIDPANLVSFIQRGLSFLEDFDVAALNVTGLAAVLNARISRGREIISLIINELQALRTQLMDQDKTQVADIVANLISEFENLRDNVAIDASNLVNEVAKLVEGLAIAFQSDLSMNVFPRIESIAEQIANISTPLVEDFFDNTVRTTVSEISGYINQYIDHLDNQIMTNVGGCQPFYGIYTQFYNDICRDFIDGLNGFWWSLGLCALLYIPTIVLATLTTSFFRKKKSQEAELSTKNDHPMKVFDPKI